MVAKKDHGKKLVRAARDSQGRKGQKDQLEHNQKRWWRGELDVLGVPFAFGAVLGWASNIELTSVWESRSKEQCFGLIVLSQAPNVIQVIGVGLVVLAGIGAQRASPPVDAAAEVVVPAST